MMSLQGVPCPSQRRYLIPSQAQSLRTEVTRIPPHHHLPILVVTAQSEMGSKFEIYRSYRSLPCRVDMRKGRRLAGARHA